MNSPLVAPDLGQVRIYLAQVGSTNDYLKARCANLPLGTAVYTCDQRAGRGRMGHGFLGAPGEQLALSLLLDGADPAALPALPLAVGIGVWRALEGMAGRAQLKWTNDVLVGRKKVCGILCEGVVTAAGPRTVVGIGVNLNQPSAYFEKAGLQYASSLRLATGRFFSPAPVVSTLLGQLEPVLHQYWAGGFAPFREEYLGACVNLGRRALATVAGRRIEGRAVDIDPTGALILQSAQGEFRVTCGEARVEGVYEGLAGAP